MALCNSLTALKAFETGCVSSRLSHSSFFYKLNSQDKAAFPFLQGISFLPLCITHTSPFCRYEGCNPAQVLPGPPCDWQPMNNPVFSFSCFLSSE